MAREKKEAALTPEERLQAALVPDWEWPYKLPGNWCWTTVGAINQYVGISADPTKAKIRLLSYTAFRAAQTTTRRLYSALILDQQNNLSKKAMFFSAKSIRG